MGVAPHRCGSCWQLGSLAAQLRWRCAAAAATNTIAATASAIVDAAFAAVISATAATGHHPRFISAGHCGHHLASPLAPLRPARPLPWLLVVLDPPPPTFQLQLCLWCSPYPFERLHLPALSHMLDRLLCAQTLLRASSRTRFDALAGLARGRPAGRGRGRRSLTCLRACCCCVCSYMCLTEP